MCTITIIIIISEVDVVQEEGKSLYLHSYPTKTKFLLFSTIGIVSSLKVYMCFCQLYKAADEAVD